MTSDHDSLCGVCDQTVTKPDPTPHHDRPPAPWNLLRQVDQGLLLVVPNLPWVQVEVGDRELAHQNSVLIFAMM